MNILKGQVDIENGQARFRFQSLALPLPDQLALEQGQPLFYGIRPVDIEIAAEGPLAGGLVLAENTGAETMLHLDVDSVDLRAVVTGRPHFPKGQRVNFSIPPEKVHVFDAATESRLN